MIGRDLMQKKGASHSQCIVYVPCVLQDVCVFLICVPHVRGFCCVRSACVLVRAWITTAHAVCDFCSADPLWCCETLFVGPYEYIYVYTHIHMYIYLYAPNLLEIHCYIVCVVLIQLVVLTNRNRNCTISGTVRDCSDCLDTRLYQMFAKCS